MISIITITITALSALYLFLKVGGSLGNFLVALKELFYPSSLFSICMYMLILLVVFYKINQTKRQRGSFLSYALLSIIIVAVVEKSFIDLNVKVSEKDIRQIIQTNRKKLDKGSKDAFNPEHWNIQVRSKSSLGLLGPIKKLGYSYSLGYNISLKEIEKLEALNRDDFVLVKLDKGKRIRHSSEVRKAIEIELAKIKANKHERAV